MIGDVNLGTNDLERAATFYDALARETGGSRMMESDRSIAWGNPGGGPGIGVIKPHDGNPASVGNGVMVALRARDRDQVDRLHRLALDLGGSDEGEPGPRGNFYAACFRDPDGNKLNAFAMPATGA